MKPYRQRDRFWRLTLALLLVAAAVGCGRPQAAPRNRELISSLRTAVNTRNVVWLEKNAKLVEQRRTDGSVSEDEYEEFQAIIGKARDGQWEKAEREVIAFQKAQRPTHEEIESITARKR